MKRLLAIDIGNTNITIGLFKGPRMVRKAKIATADRRSYRRKIAAFLGPLPFDGDVVISSVVPSALDALTRTLKGLVCGKVIVVGKDTIAPIRNRYRVKSQVGQDRLVNAFAAATLYGSPAVVIDFGTAITFDIVSKRGEYLGGLILPGIGISFTALYEKTALLPRVALSPVSAIIGKDTKASMRGGILFGFGAMCDGLVARYRAILGPRMRVIATGGNASLVRRYARSIRIVDSDLTLKGLVLIYASR